jgi:hypothetical protein
MAADAQTPLVRRHCRHSDHRCGWRFDLVDRRAVILLASGNGAECWDCGELPVNSFSGSLQFRRPGKP